ncbi:hypothetical protein [Pedobacter agri]|uniref:HNH endonuclease n=1 Tax=Pedobacter agri TaxID=454586 RepID=UPI00292D6E76|nr:hypothetical protein [Pedobacter agri]
MINLNLNDVEAKNHFNNIKNIIQARTKNILKSGISIRGHKASPFGYLRTYLVSLLDDSELEKIITDKPENFESTITKITRLYPDFIDESSDSHFVLYNIFIKNCYNLSGRFSKYDFISKIGRDTCPYCNRNYIYYLSKSKEIKPQIDHFFPKSKYPFLAMSFYNLIPSCQTCNGFGAKEEKDPLKEGLINPYLLKSSDFIFTYKPVSSKIISTFLDKKSITIEITKNIPGHLDVFKLKELYELHSDHVVELIFKSKIKYSETYRNYLEKYKEKGLKFSENEIDRMILGNYVMEEDIHKRPLAKLYQDIGKELGLIK